MPNAKITQQIIEAIDTSSSTVRSSQLLLEPCQIPNVQKIQTTQVLVEPCQIPNIQRIRLTQLVIETIEVRTVVVSCVSNYAY